MAAERNINASLRVIGKVLDYWFQAGYALLTTEQRGAPIEVFTAPERKAIDHLMFSGALRYVDSMKTVLPYDALLRILGIALPK